MNIARKFSERSLAARFPEGYFPPTTRKDATFVNQRIFSSPDGQVIPDVLRAIRRVRKLFQSYSILQDHYPDILSDLTQFGGQNIGPAEAESAIVAIEAACLSFESLVDMKMRRVEYILKKTEVSEAALIAKNEIRRRIFFYWDCHSRSPSDQAINLTKYFVSSLGFIVDSLIQADALHTFVEPRNTSDLPGSWIYKPVDSQTPQIKIKKILSSYSEAVSNLTFDQIMSMISELDWPKRVAVLKMAGYFYPQENIAVHRRRVRREANTLQEDLVLGLSVLILRTRKFPTQQSSPVYVKELIRKTEEEIPIYALRRRGNQVSLEELVSPVEEEKDSPETAYYSAGGIKLDRAFSRVRLAELGEIDSVKLFKLSETETKLLQLAVANMDRKFVYSNQQLSEMVGISKKTIPNMLLRILKKIEPSPIVFINRNGRKISESSVHYRLLSLKMNLDKKMLSNLSERQQTIFQMLTTPDCSGKYPTVEEAQDQLGRFNAGILPGIERSLTVEDPYLSDLIDSVKKGIQLYEEKFSHLGKQFTFQHYQIMRAVLDFYEQGLPLRGENFQTLSTSLGLNADAVKQFINKTLKRKLTAAGEH